MTTKSKPASKRLWLLGKLVLMVMLTLAARSVLLAECGSCDDDMAQCCSEQDCSAANSPCACANCYCYADGGCYGVSEQTCKNNGCDGVID
jgi:hypothetical protein